MGYDNVEDLRSKLLYAQGQLLSRIDQVERMSQSAKIRTKEIEGLKSDLMLTQSEVQSLKWGIHHLKVGKRILAEDCDALKRRVKDLEAEVRDCKIYAEAAKCRVEEVKQTCVPGTWLMRNVTDIGTAIDRITEEKRVDGDSKTG